MALSYVVHAPLNDTSSPNAAKMQKASENKMEKIRRFLFGKVRDGGGLFYARICTHATM